MPEIRVETDSAHYSVHLGSGLLQPQAGASSLVGLPAKASRVIVVTSPEVERFWGESLRRALGNGIPVNLLHVPAGEQHKRLSTVERLCEELAALGADRDTLLIALGGGVIGDITGFVAAIYMRGIRFLQVPTTLLAQVDSSVGGKTGVNLAAGKNLVGSFHQPVAVIADLDTLRTLPVRELRAGLQESVKSAIIRDAALFDFMEANLDAVLAGDSAALERVVESSIRVKAAVVAADEREGGLRMILNFGHTVGHAIEAATEYKHLLHGEAIGWGMLAAIHLGESRGVLPAADANRMRELIRRTTDLPNFAATTERLVALTGSDKKKRSGTLSFILPIGIGQVEIVNDVTEAELSAAVAAMLAEVQAISRASGVEEPAHAG
ncbi:3-dehydroquinate synthase [Terriglobus aquaticus]|uniref:3-dehydroquinate synthase n=1 Tax=Terriglobus aquaticus TaxID=940139 RepID=A0ABW9KG16_9BACT|nr:3-dehydroquinate synthase [Terriglobus aquaticus]